MGNALLFLACIAFLYRFSAIDPWWLCFAAVFGILVKCGLKVGIFGLFVAMGIAKVLKDLFKKG